MKKAKKTTKTPEAPLQQHSKEHLNAFVREIAGEEGLKIVTCIGGTEVTDEKIEQGTRMKIAEIRSVLNHLHSYGLVEYKREKNLQTGWFTYTWRLNPNRALQNFINMKRREYETLKTKLATGDGVQLYKCTRTCAALEFEKAMERSFKCPACNGKLNVVDQEEELRKLEQRINALVSITNQQPELPRSVLGQKLTNFGR